MTSLRFQLVSLAALAAAAPAFAQIAPAQAGSVRDIEVSRTGDKVSILIELSQQPAAAQATPTANGLALQIDGVDLLSLQLDPPPGSLVTRVEAAGKQITLTGAGFGEASTVIYRNAVLVEAKLAEPPLRGASLMTAKAEVPAPVAAVQPKAPDLDPKPVDLKPAEAKPAAPKPVAPKPAAAPPPAAHTADDHLESKTPPQTPPKAATPKAAAGQSSNPAALAGTAALAGLNAQRCAVAVGDLENDPWSIEALGNHALCLLDQGKSKEASNRLDQLAAFAPEDWRVSLGRAILAAEKGDASNAEVGYRTAAQLAPDDLIRAAISARVTQDQATKPAAH